MDLNKKIWQWTAVVVMSLMWGSSFILIKKSLEAYSPYQSGALRMILAYLFFLPFAIKRIKKINRKNIFPLFFVGFIGNFFPAFMFAFGESHINSSLASMLNSTTPIFVLLIGVMFFRVKTRIVNILGLIIGFVGTMGLIVKDFSSLTNDWNIGAIVILFASMFYGINTNVIKTNLKELDGLSIASLGFFLIGPFAVAYFFSTDLSRAFQSPFILRSTVSLIVLAFFSSFIALIIFNLLIKHTTAIFAASTTYFMPIIAIMWGILDKEQISILQIISILIILAGVSLVNKKYIHKNKLVQSIN